MPDCKKCLHRIVCGKRPKIAGATIAECGFYKDSQPQTNADRIRAMSDEELANVVVCPHTGNWDLCRDDCKKCRLEWLKQPAEGERQ